MDNVSWLIGLYIQIKQPDRARIYIFYASPVEETYNVHEVNLDVRIAARAENRERIGKGWDRKRIGKG